MLSQQIIKHSTCRLFVSQLGPIAGRTVLTGEPPPSAQQLASAHGGPAAAVPVDVNEVSWSCRARNMIASAGWHRHIKKAPRIWNDEN